MRSTIPVLMVTYGRLAYSVQAFNSILSFNANHPVKITIWDNCSDDGTRVWLKSIQGHRDIEEIVLRDRNEGLARAVNYFFRKHHDAKYVVKVDNDTVMPENWLDDLLEAYDYAPYPKIGAISGTCLRPNGDTFADWVKNVMKTVPLKDDFLHFNSYVLGTGVLINMDMIRTRGLLFEHFPCKISGWTDYTRIAAEWEEWRFAFYSKVPVKLLNLAAEHVLSNDFPAYDAELKEARDSGNLWWDSVGGLSGVRQYVADHGGLTAISPATEPPPPLEEPVTKKRYLTTCDLHVLRSTPEYWKDRVAKLGTYKSTFADAPQDRVSEFTVIHQRVLKDWVVGKDILDVGCGWGRMSQFIAKYAKSYIGVDFVPALIDKARESLPKLRFEVASPVDGLPFDSESFDGVVAITCVSSFDENFWKVMRELKRVIRPHGAVMLLEEGWMRMDWKLKAGLEE